MSTVDYVAQAADYERILAMVVSDTKTEIVTPGKSIWVMEVFYQTYPRAEKTIKLRAEKWEVVSKESGGIRVKQVCCRGTPDEFESFMTFPVRRIFTEAHAINNALAAALKTLESEGYTVTLCEAKE